MAKPRSLALRAVLTVPFVLLTSAAVGLVAYYSYANSQRAVADLARQLREEVSDRVRDRLRSYLHAPHQINQLNFMLVTVRTKSPVPSSQSSKPQPIQSLPEFPAAELERFFWQQMQSFNVGYINYATARGEFIGLERLDNGDITINEVSRAKGLGTVRVFATDARGQRSRLLATKPYDPRNEAWFAEPARAKRPLWSSIYRWEDKPEVLSISASYPIFGPQGQLQGVVGVDLILSQIDDFLRELQVGKTGSIAIVEPSGAIVATSSRMPVRHSLRGKDERMHIYEYGDPLLRAAALEFHRQFKGFADVVSDREFEFFHAGKHFFARVSRYADSYGLEWFILTTVPESDFMEGVYASTISALWLCAGTLAIAIVLGLVTSRWIVRPIQHLSEVAGAIAQSRVLMREYLTAIPAAHPIIELNSLARSFSEMMRRLQELLHQLEEQAFCDRLTGLDNKNAMIYRLRECIERQQEGGQHFAVLYLDIDRYRAFKYGYGHAMAERLIATIAARLKEAIGNEAGVARIGEDEFAVLLPHLQSPGDASRRADEIHAALDRPIDLNGKTVLNPTIGIGIAYSQHNASEPEVFLQAADTAMHYAKRWGKGRTVFYSPGMQTLVVERLQLEDDLHRAIQEQQLRLHYQPIVCLQSGRPWGFEALMRWEHPRRGTMPPSKFIPLAEENGAIVSLGRWALIEACSRLRQWQHAFPQLSPLHMSVNLSEVQLREASTIADIESLVRSLPPYTLKLEITETSLMVNAEAACATLQTLKTLGVRISIDDFGTGYSSLSYLQRLPIDTLKIDRAFVRDIETNLKHFDIIRAILQLARSLGMDAVAEGVETSGQVEILRSLGCHFGQGYFFSPPLPEASVAAYLGQ